MAARLDLPTIVVSGGPMLAGEHPTKPGTRIDLITVFESVGAVKSGKMAASELDAIEDARRDLGYEPIKTVEEALRECLPYCKEALAKAKAAGRHLEVVAVVVVEQTTNSILSLSNQLIEETVSVSIIAFLIGGGALFVFALIATVVPLAIAIGSALAGEAPTARVRVAAGVALVGECPDTVIIQHGDVLRQGAVVVIADDDVGGLGQLELEGIGAKEFGLVGKPGVRDRLASGFEDVAFLDEENLACAGLQGHEPEQPGTAAEIQYDLAGLNRLLKGFAVALDLDAVGQVPEMLFQRLGHGRIMPSSPGFG